MPTDQTAIGGGMVGCETAYYLHQQGFAVRILEKLDQLCPDEEPMHRGFLEAYLRENTAVETGVTVTRINCGEVEYQTAAGQEAVEKVSLIVTACGSRPQGAPLYHDLLEQGYMVYRIGDCVTVGNMRSATRSAMDVAYIL